MGLEQVARCDVCGKIKDGTIEAGVIIGGNAEAAVLLKDEKYYCPACLERLMAFVLRGTKPPTPKSEKK